LGKKEENMLTASIIIFAIAAVLGLTIIIRLLKGKPTIKPVVFLHGGVAATALVILIIYAINNAMSPTASIVIFVIAALGGFILLANDLRKKPGPKALAVIHALAAVTAFIILLLFTF
jgi:hypothetical protein